MNLKDAYLHGTDLGALVKNISWSSGKLVIKWALEGKADTTLDTPVSGGTITLSTTALTYLTANGSNYTIKMPDTDPYTSARTPTTHYHDDRYLLLTGGTLHSTNFYTLTVNGGTDGAGILFTQDGDNPKLGIVLYKPTDWGMAILNYSVSKAIGITNDGTPYFGWGNTKNTLYHTGNLSPMTTSHAANGITSTNISNWNSVYEWFSVAANNDGTGDAINKWKELEAFLTSITDDQTLSGLLAGRVAKSGDTMTGALTTPGLTVTGAATFSQAINGSILGNAATASRLQNARNIAISGAVTGNANFDGSGNITISTSVNHSHSQYLPLAGGLMTGQLTWSGNSALPLQTSPQYFLVIDAFTSGGTTKWSDVLNTLKALGIKDSSGNNVYLPLTGGTLTNTGYILTVNNSGGGDSGIKIQRAVNTAWGILVSSGNFYLKELTTNTNFLTINEVSQGSLATFAGLVKSTGFVKTTSSDSYVLLGGGGHKLISEFTTLSGEQTVTGNKTFSGSVTIDDLTAGNLVVTGGASFAQTINGNAATASKLATARTISLTGSVTGSGTFDGSGNLSIATTTNHTHDYLPLAGGTMTGAAPINFAPNTVQMNFRPEHSSYNAKLEYMTNGNEALVFATKASVTSFMFVNGLDLTNRSDYATIGATTTNKIAMQIKSNKVTINKAIRGDSDSQTAALDVGGTILSEKLGYSGLTYKTDYRFVHDSACYIKQNSSTGTICIKLPVRFNSTNGEYDMPVFKLTIYEYSGLGASEILIGGHNWNGSWYNVTYTVKGNYNKGVRLGRVDSEENKPYCILLGTTTTTWNYVAVYVTDIYSQYSHDWIANWINACTISQITDESGLAGIVTPSYGDGNLGEYKTKQTAVDTIGASTNTLTFINSISQDVNGVITATTGVVRDASASVAGVVNTGDLTFAGAKTFNGLITTSSDSNHRGIKVGNTYINAINGELIFQNNSSIRFGGDSWDYNVWAGLKYVHSSKVIYLGLADGSAFTANSAQSAGKIYTPGIDNIYIGNGTYTVYHSGNVNATTVPWAAEYLQLKNVTDDWNITLNENKLRFISCTGTTATGAPGAYYSGLSVMTGYVGFLLCTYGGAIPNLKFRKLQDNGTWHGWYDILHSDNYTDYVYSQSTANSRFVLKAGDTMTGALTVPSLSVTGAATFSQAINGSILGNAATASRLLNARNIAISGAVTGNANFDGSGNITISTSVNHTHNYAGSSSAGGAATNVVVNDSDSNSTYRMVWHSGNTLYSTGGIYCNPNSDTLYAANAAFGTKSQYYQRSTTGTVHHEFVGSDQDYGVMKIRHANTEGSGGAGTYTATLAVIDERTGNLSTGYEPNFYINKTVANSGTEPDLMGITRVGTRLFTIASTGFVTSNVGLAVVNDSSDNSYNSLAYFRCYSNNNWGMIIDKSTSYTYGLYIKAGGSYALKVDGSSRFASYLKVGADAAPSCALDVTGDIVASGDVRVSGNDLYVGSASGLQCHQQYDSTNKVLKFYFD